MAWPSFTRRLFGRRAPLLVVLWLIAGFAVWNVVFDRVIVQASRDYVSRQEKHQRGEGPPVTIDGIMVPARRAAGQVATLAGIGITVLGLASTACLQARRMRRAQAAPGPSPERPGSAGAR